MRVILLSALAALPAIYAADVSRNGRCGVGFGYTCLGSSYGDRVLRIAQLVVNLATVPAARRLLHHPRLLP
jgi:hypothetical protein